MTCHILSPVLFFENHFKAAHFVRPLYDKLVSIGSTLLTLLPPKNAVFFPTGMHLPVGNSFDVRKVIGSSPISSTKPLVKTSGFFLFISLFTVRKFNFLVSSKIGVYDSTTGFFLKSAFRKNLCLATGFIQIPCPKRPDLYDKITT